MGPAKTGMILSREREGRKEKRMEDVEQREKKEEGQKRVPKAVILFPLLTWKDKDNK